MESYDAKDTGFTTLLLRRVYKNVCSRFPFRVFIFREWQSSFRLSHAETCEIVSLTKILAVIVFEYSRCRRIEGRISKERGPRKGNERKQYYIQTNWKNMNTLFLVINASLRPGPGYQFPSFFAQGRFQSFQPSVHAFHNLIKVGVVYSPSVRSDMHRNAIHGKNIKFTQLLLRILI